MAAKKKASSKKPAKKIATDAEVSAAAKKVISTLAPIAAGSGVKIANQEYRIAGLQELRVHPKNPKKGDVEAIGESIEKNDFYGAAVVQKSTGYILAGNHRYKGALEKGMKEIPIIEIDCDDEVAERILLADNRIADLGTYDQAILLANIEERAKAGGLAGTGYLDTDLERLKSKLNPPEAFPEYNGQVKVKYKCPKCSFEWS